MSLSFLPLFRPWSDRSADPSHPTQVEAILMSNPQPSAHPSTQNSAQRSVLITGASGGVGDDALLGALEAARPKARYTVGPDTRPIGLPARLPPRTRDRLLTRVLGLNKVKPAVPGAVPAPVAEQAATPASRA